MQPWLILQYLFLLCCVFFFVRISPSLFLVSAFRGLIQRVGTVWWPFSLADMAVNWRRGFPYQFVTRFFAFSLLFCFIGRNPPRTLEPFFWFRLVLDGFAVRILPFCSTSWATILVFALPLWLDLCFHRKSIFRTGWIFPRKQGWGH